MRVEGLGKSQGSEAGSLIFFKAEWETESFQNEPSRTGRSPSLTGAPVERKQGGRNFLMQKTKPRARMTQQGPAPAMATI